MATYRELVYMCLDQVKQRSDDSFFTEEHVLFLMDTFRKYLLKQQEIQNKIELSDSSYQTICFDLEVSNLLADVPCAGKMLKSKQKIPALAHIGSVSVYPTNYFLNEITFVSKEKFRYAGSSKWTQNFIYATVDPQGYLYFKSANPQHYYLNSATMTAIFDKAEDAAKLSCESKEKQCEWFDTQYPIDGHLQGTLIENVVGVLTNKLTIPEDTSNNANDDVTDLANYLAQHLKNYGREQ
jgi:hypothetical protein